MRPPTSLDALLDSGSSLPVTPRNDLNNGQPHDLTKGPRIAYSVVSIFCMLLLATMLGETHAHLHKAKSSHTRAKLTSSRFANPYFHWSQA